MPQKSTSSISDRPYYVLKEYRNIDKTAHEGHYVTEIKALTLLQNNPSDNIISFYGSFRKGTTGYLVLEYATGGSLVEYFQGTDPPTTRLDAARFWKSLFDVLKGLDRIHQSVRLHGDSIAGCVILPLYSSHAY
jgi:serine/threonine protein kinase